MKSKTYLGLLLVCLVAITVIAVGAVAIRQGKENETTEILDINSQEDVAMNTEEVTTQEPTSKLVSSIDVTEKSDETFEDIDGEEVTTTKAMENTAQTETTAVAETVNAEVSKLHFDKNDILTWPVDGNVIVDFNMENTIYFKTLNQYKCSSAIAIQSELNNDVLCAATGEVVEVGTNEEIGNYVVMSLGDGYELTYGQLKDIQVNEGQVVESQELIGYINEPTKYYTLEGYNLYLKLTENGTPIDPLDYLNY
ncbi:MAG: M23 family metallopeptidase [Lachnospiraceae bacterium]|nr:M23 family metallopeptidase [Lachnospiraceae bacterium]MBQ4068785.1 M23 family metallopeptidase [Lachnospiraceae bacterium]